MIEQLIAEVRALSEQYPDNTYTKVGKFCSYNRGHNTHSPEPGCIFGQAFRKLGFSTKMGAKYGVFDLLNGESNDIHTILRHLYDEVNMTHAPPNQILRWCSTVQSTQDNGHSWAKAIAAADKEYPLV
jgi:hypothetical protein